MALKTQSYFSGQGTQGAVFTMFTAQAVQLVLGAKHTSRCRSASTRTQGEALFSQSHTPCTYHT